VARLAATSLFDHAGIVEAHTACGGRPRGGRDRGGPTDFEALSHQQNDDVPEGRTGARLSPTAPPSLRFSTWLAQMAGRWSRAKSAICQDLSCLNDAARAKSGSFSQALEDHDDVQRVWAAVK